MPEVCVADSAARRADAYAVRRAVFVEEQGVDEEIEYDEHEDDAVHFVAYDGDEPIGAARLRVLEEGRGADVERAAESPALGKVERVAVLASRRGEGVGRDLMAAVEERARALGLTALKLHSQTRAAAFYRGLGYEPRGEEFEEAGIPHVEMRKRLADSGG